MLKTVLTDTLEIAYEEAGEPTGGPVILLHGFPDDAKAWAAVARGLSDAGFYAIALICVVSARLVSGVPKRLDLVSKQHSPLISVI